MTVLDIHSKHLLEMYIVKLNKRNRNQYLGLINLNVLGYIKHSDKMSKISVNSINVNKVHP